MQNEIDRADQQRLRRAAAQGHTYAVLYTVDGQSVLAAETCDKSLALAAARERQETFQAGRVYRQVRGQWRRITR